MMPHLVAHRLILSVWPSTGTSPTRAAGKSREATASQVGDCRSWRARSVRRSRGSDAQDRCHQSARGRCPPRSRAETVKRHALATPAKTVLVVLHRFGAFVELVGCYSSGATLRTGPRSCTGCEDGSIRAGIGVLGRPGPSGAEHSPASRRTFSTDCWPEHLGLLDLLPGPSSSNGEATVPSQRGSRCALGRETGWRAVETTPAEIARTPPAQYAGPTRLPRVDL